VTKQEEAESISE